MISGWDGSYRRGEFAYADAEWFLTWSGDISFGEDDLGRLSVSRTYRYYYYLEFDKETADYYRAVETGQDLDQERKLDLDVKNFEAPGLEFFYDLPSFIVNDHEISVGAGISLYEPGHFQFGELKGVAAAGDTSAASATLNYRYDDDKILDHQAGVDKGIGYSLSVKAGWKYQDYRVKLSLRDLVNRFEWRNGAFTRGCINIGGGGQARCQAEGAASGISSQEKITETIPLTSRLAISYEPYDTEVHYYGHGQYQSLGVEKGFRDRSGPFRSFPVLSGACRLCMAIRIVRYKNGY